MYYIALHCIVLYPAVASQFDQGGLYIQSLFLRNDLFTTNGLYGLQFIVRYNSGYVWTEQSSGLIRYYNSMS